jgi:hypothetical protein
MDFLHKLFGKKQAAIVHTNTTQMSQPIAFHSALCKVDIIEPSNQDSMFPTYVKVGVIQTGLSIQFDSLKADKLDGFTRPAVIGEYHWLNNEYNTEPFLLLYSNIEKITCKFFKKEGIFRKCVETTEKILEFCPDDVDLKIYFLYHNKGKGTKLKVHLEIIDDKENTDNEAAREMYNAMILATTIPQ